MRKMLWVLCGLVVAAPAYAAESDPCKRNRQIFLDTAAEYDCPDEEAEGKALVCSGSAAADIKPTKRFYDLLKACKAKGKKGGAAPARSASKESKPAEKKADAGASGELPAGKHKYRALDEAGAVIAIAGSDKSGADAIGGVKDKIKAEKCEGAETIKITLQSYRDDGTWTKGISSDVRCKK